MTLPKLCDFLDELKIKQDKGESITNLCHNHIKKCQDATEKSIYNMTVGELSQRLKEYDPSALVVFSVSIADKEKYYIADTWGDASEPEIYLLQKKWLAD